VGEELNIPRRSIDPRDTIILTPFSSIAFPLEHVIHPAAAAGEDGECKQRLVAATAVGVDGFIYFRRCGVGGGRGGEAPTRWIVNGVVGERGVSKGDISRSMAVVVEGGDGGGGGSYRDFITIFLNLGATVLF
jgi:hypothetical protein